MEDCGFFGGCGARWERWLPGTLRRVDRASLPKRRWRLLVCAAGTAADTPVYCHTLLLPRGVPLAGVTAEQVVDCGVGRQCSLTLSSLSPQPVLCVQRQLTDLRGAAVEVQELLLPAAWSCLETQPLLLLAGTRLLMGELL